MRGNWRNWNTLTCTCGHSVYAKKDKKNIRKGIWTCSDCGAMYIIIDWDKPYWEIQDSQYRLRYIPLSER